MTRRALCVGINDYPGTGSDLRGCVNDARDWRSLLDSREYETRLLLDADATRQNMRDAITQVVAATAPGDIGVITFSGHGSWKVDEDADEADLRDELLCPYDINEGNYLSDDELYEIFGDRERGARIVLISDSCHSGTVARVAPPSEEDDSPDRVRFLAPETFLDASPLQHARALRAPRLFSRPRASALLLAGCQDTEYSYDASFGGRPNGAFTYVAIRALDKAGPGAAYSDWFDAIRQRLPSASHPQTPNLQGTTYQRRWTALQ